MVVIGGLITSTFLSLLVIRVVFTQVDDLVGWFAKKFHAAFGGSPLKIGRDGELPGGPA